MNKLSDFILNYITEDSPAKLKKQKQNRKKTKFQKERNKQKKLQQSDSSNESKPEFDDVDHDLLRWKKSGGVKNFVQNGPRTSILKSSSLTSTSSSPTSSSTSLSSTPLSSSSPTSSFWSNAKNHLGNHKLKYAAGAGAVTAAGIGAAALRHHNKNKGILNKIKDNPGKAAGASLAALGAGAGAAALIRYLRKKRKQQ